MYSPETCIQELEKHADAVDKSTAKLQIILEYFKELSCNGGKEKFDNLDAFANGIHVLCKEAIDSLWECGISDIREAIGLFSPDPGKVEKHVEYLKSIGIKDATVEFYPPEGEPKRP